MPVLEPSTRFLTITPVYAAVSLAIYFTVPEGSILRYLIYLVPLLMVAELGRGGSITILRSTETAWGVVGIYLACGLMIGGVDIYGLKEAIFILASISLFCLPYRVRHSFQIMLLVAAILNVAFVGWTNSFNVPLFSLEYAQSPAETSFGLILPLVAIAFVLRRKYLWFFLSFAVALLMYKRVALLSLFLALGFGFWLSMLKGPLRGAIAAFVVSACVAIGLNAAWVYEVTSQFAQSQFGVFVAPDNLSSGRHFAMEAFSRLVFDQADLVQHIFGGGPGHSTALLAQLPEFRSKNFPLLHNDWLRILVDYGWVGVGCVMVVFWRALCGSRLAVMIAIFTALLFITDNVATYLSYWIVVALIWRSDLSRGRTAKETPAKNEA